MYWALALAQQEDDDELKTLFTPVARQLMDNENKIVGELNSVQGEAVDLGGYYRPERDKVVQIMRPSSTFNSIVDSIT